MTTMPRPIYEAKEDKDIDLAHLFDTFINNRLLILAITGFFTALGIAYALLATPVYMASAMIQIEPKNGLPSLSDVVNATPAVSPAQTEISLLKSRSVVGGAVESLNLDINIQPHYFPLIGGFMARRFEPSEEGELGWYPAGFGSYAWGGEQLKITQLSVPENMHSEELTLEALDTNGFILRDPDGEVVVQGPVGEEMVMGDYSITVSELVARPGTTFSVIKSRTYNTTEDYQNRLAAGERGKQSGIINVTLEDPDPAKAILVLEEVAQRYVDQNVARNAAEATKSLEFLSEQVPAVRKKLDAAQTALNKYQTGNRSVDISAETQSVLDRIVDLEKQISEQNLKRTEMERRFTRQHPNFQALINQINQLQGQKEELEKQIGTLPSTQQELLRLTRDVEVASETYAMLLNKTQELDIIRAGTVGNVQIIDHAAADIENPVKPNKPLIVIAAMLLGGILAVAFVYVREALKRGVENPEDIERVGIPVYAAIPFSEKQGLLEKRLANFKRDKSSASYLLAINDPADLATEAMRSLRTSLHFAMIEAKNNILMITGPSPMVGKSFVTTNLAAVIAQSGKKVLLVDADMRKGYLHKVMRCQSEKGLSDILSGRITLFDAIQKTQLNNLHVIAHGQLPPNPSELLMHENFSRFVKEISGMYDLVIFDTPPILAVTDAALVGGQAGTTLMVTRYGINGVKEIEFAKRRLEQNGLLVKGVIFNAVERKASTYSEYGYYQYEYQSK
ncbi:polysaccharide biosynthesis tyrosine autokinase [Stutzerimonas nitrititolerans]|uniref:Polysaccharide biosynthesis tyrosine autokinase n=1 Tax=Stutzerimonas nitrititolerans TaxID=2482751 RepID=A0ABX9V3P7_9GAMM|nr:polysaccharide biosynthesis tyrosine autokinase [Stutzerimonas nitrititolerans]AFN77734.1 tyrosine-protein kinase [Stutzerimonas stutzeri DSM 10701]MBA1184011.1 polysaccharide biosynthesis tyrosine autokinase [Stutzerimonas stutzeri]HAQ74678.1 tyrosine-protein kinase [Pseudomonas sp.]MBT1118891.1 polysaccharide biosynthesis tyrosine autokinase [Stutzerimonas nitrititolerans]NNT95931.1 polysaccharide biosynthesis tyrosine autokinase [Stutzerimonas nitrititolerans]